MALFMLLQSLLSAVVVLVVLLVILLMLLCVSDCDLTLAYYALRGGNLHRLRGKVVWITGASSGIGESLAYCLARHGAKLVLSARREDELKRVADKCSKLSPVDYKDSHVTVPLDIAKYEEHSAVVDKVFKIYKKVDFLVNNAGQSQRSVAIDTDFDVIKTVIAINTLGTISLTKAALQYMVKQDTSCIVITNSVAGKIGAPGSAGYSASKHALQGYFDALRMELADQGVSILSVCPGPVHSNFGRSVLGKTTLAAPVDTSSGRRVATDRCAFLMAVTMANKLEEVWISLNPILLFTYAAQYTPVFTKFLGKRIGNRRAKAIEQEKPDIDGDYFTRQS